MCLLWKARRALEAEIAQGRERRSGAAIRFQESRRGKPFRADQTR